MARRIVETIICDRCTKVYDQHVAGGTEGTESAANHDVVITIGGVEVVRFRDLCGLCDKVVHGMIDKIKLSDEEKAPVSTAPPGTPVGKQKPGPKPKASKPAEGDNAPAGETAPPEAAPVQPPPLEAAPAQAVTGPLAPEPAAQAEAPAAPSSAPVPPTLAGGYAADPTTPF